MRMTEITFEGQPPIDGYGPGGFRIAGDWHEGGLILLPGGIHRLDGIPAPDTLAPLLAAAGEIDVVLFGMGADIAPLPEGTAPALDAAGIGHEVMSTPSACRTYNVLLTEDRRVACVLLAP